MGAAARAAPANFKESAQRAWGLQRLRLGVRDCPGSEAGVQLHLQRLRQPGWGFSEGAWGCSRYPSPPLSSPVVAAPSSCRRIIPTRLTLQVVAVWCCKTFRSAIMSSPVMSCIPSPQPCSPRHSRHRIVPASSSPRRRLRAAVPTSVVIASTWPPASPCPRRRRAVVPAPSSPRRRLRVAAASSPRHRPRTVVSAPFLNPHPILTFILTCRRPSSSVLASFCSPRSAILTRSSPSHRCVVVATSSPRRRRVVVAGSSAPSSSRRHVVASSFLPVVAASSPRRHPCLSPLPRPRVVVVPASCRVAPASSPPSILTFILTSVLTLSSPRRRLVASSSPSSLRCRRVAVELSCHSAVVAAAFPASSPPRRLVSAPSSFHRAVIGPSRRSSVRLGAPSSSPRRSLVQPGAPSSSFQSSSPPFGAGVPPSSPKSSSPPLRRRCSPAQHRHRRSRHRPLIRCMGRRTSRRRRSPVVAAVVIIAAVASSPPCVPRRPPTCRTW